MAPTFLITLRIAGARQCVPLAPDPDVTTREQAEAAVRRALDAVGMHGWEIEDVREIASAPAQETPR